MSKRLLSTIAVAAASTTAFACISVTAEGQAQAAVLTYEADFGLTSTVVLPDQSTSQLPIANAAVTFTKAPSSSQPGFFDYTFESFLGSFLGTPYTTADLLAPAGIALAQSLNPLFPIKYQALLPAIVSGKVPTYVGDGDFPPSGPLTYAFSGQDVSAAVAALTPSLSSTELSLVSQLAGLFTNGGEVTFSSQLLATAPDTGTEGLPVDPPSPITIDTGSVAGAPEPTTIAGLALAGIGMATARRRIKKAA